MVENNFVILQDEDCHKYKVPVDLEKEFKIEMSKAYESENFDQFEEKYKQYMVGDMTELSSLK